MAWNLAWGDCLNRHSHSRISDEKPGPGLLNDQPQLGACGEMSTTESPGDVSRYNTEGDWAADNEPLTNNISDCFFIVCSTEILASL